jgi:1-aminocyclopropane-1-carboxylate deaminase
MIDFENTLIIDTIQDSFLEEKNIQLDILRLDLIHPQISGNKWFKLKYNIQEALSNKASGLLSFGGAYSNHIHALAFAGKLFNLKTIGIIRGDEISNETLSDCVNWGMQLRFISREEYKNKDTSLFLERLKAEFLTYHIITEGGNNELGRKGTQEILNGIQAEKYNHICCAVGTGATLSGIIESVKGKSNVLGFSSIKGGFYIEDELKQNTSFNNWTLIHDYHFGGFSKTNKKLHDFITEFKIQHNVELDFIYTGKMMFGIYDMIRSHNIPEGSSILMVHTGGLQGNRSLK